MGGCALRFLPTIDRNRAISAQLRPSSSHGQRDTSHWLADHFFHTTPCPQRWTAAFVCSRESILAETMWLNSNKIQKLRFKTFLTPRITSYSSVPAITHALVSSERQNFIPNVTITNKATPTLASKASEKCGHG